MRRDGGKKPQFLIIRKRNIWAWRTDNPDRIETLEKISIYARAIWQRKSRLSEAIVRKIELILPVGQISDAQCAIAQERLAKRHPLLCPNLLQLSAACGHRRTCWRPDPVANDPLTVPTPSDALRRRASEQPSQRGNKSASLQFPHGMSCCGTS